MANVRIKMLFCTSSRCFAGCLRVRTLPYQQHFHPDPWVSAFHGAQLSEHCDMNVPAPHIHTKHTPNTRILQLCSMHPAAAPHSWKPLGSGVEKSPVVLQGTGSLQPYMTVTVLMFVHPLYSDIFNNSWLVNYFFCTPKYFIFYFNRWFYV